MSANSKRQSKAARPDCKAWIQVEEEVLAEYLSKPADGVAGSACYVAVAEDDVITIHCQAKQGIVDEFVLVIDGVIRACEPRREKPITFDKSLHCAEGRGKRTAGPTYRSDMVVQDRNEEESEYAIDGQEISQVGTITIQGWRRKVAAENDEVEAAAGSHAITKFPTFEEHREWYHGTHYVNPAPGHLPSFEIGFIHANNSCQKGGIKTRAIEAGSRDSSDWELTYKFDFHYRSVRDLKALGVTGVSSSKSANAAAEAKDASQEPEENEKQLDLSAALSEDNTHQQEEDIRATSSKSVTGVSATVKTAKSSKSKSKEIDVEENAVQEDNNELMTIIPQQIRLRDLNNFLKPDAKQGNASEPLVISDDEEYSGSEADTALATPIEAREIDDAAADNSSDEEALLPLNDIAPETEEMDVDDEALATVKAVAQASDDMDLDSKMPVSVEDVARVSEDLDMDNEAPPSFKGAAKNSGETTSLHLEPLTAMRANFDIDEDDYDDHASDLETEEAMAGAHDGSLENKHGKQQGSNVSLPRNFAMPLPSPAYGVLTPPPSALKDYSTFGSFSRMNKKSVPATSQASSPTPTSKGRPTLDQFYSPIKADRRKSVPAGLALKVASNEQRRSSMSNEDAVQPESEYLKGLSQLYIPHGSSLDLFATSLPPSAKPTDLKGKSIDNSKGHRSSSISSIVDNDASQHQYHTNLSPILGSPPEESAANEDPFTLDTQANVSGDENGLGISQLGSQSHSSIVVPTQISLPKPRGRRSSITSQAPSTSNAPASKKRNRQSSSQSKPKATGAGQKRKSEASSSKGPEPKRARKSAAAPAQVTFADLLKDEEKLNKKLEAELEDLKGYNSALDEIQELRRRNGELKRLVEEEKTRRDTLEAEISFEQ